MYVFDFVTQMIKFTWSFGHSPPFTHTYDSSFGILQTIYMTKNKTHIVRIILTLKVTKYN